MASRIDGSALRGRSTTFFLVNPASANGSTGKRWPAIQRRAAEAGVVGQALLSSRPGEVSDLAERAAGEGAELVVVVGGDGTVNEVVNGLMRADAQPDLAVVAQGTGNDFIRTHRIPAGLDGALAVARDGRSASIDVGRVSFPGSKRYFANVASVGMSGAVAQRANSSSKALGGRISFFWALVREFAVWRNTEMTVTLADGTERRGRMHDVVVANGQYHGGAMWLAPEARPDDGLFDILLFGDVTKSDFVRTAPRLYRGTHLAHPKVELLRSKTVQVEAVGSLPLETDGEQVGTTPATFEVVPGALRVRVP